MVHPVWIGAACDLGRWLHAHAERVVRGSQQAVWSVRARGQRHSVLRNRAIETVGDTLFRVSLFGNPPRSQKVPTLNPRTPERDMSAAANFLADHRRLARRF